MKKWILPFLMLGLLFTQLFSTWANASSWVQLERLEKSNPDYSEIEKIQTDIIEFFQGVDELADISTMPEDFSLDLASAVKIYVGTDIFASQSTITQEILSQLDSGPYIWLLNVEYDGKIFQVDLARSDSGKWQPTCIEENDEIEPNYEKAVNDKLNAISYNQPNVQVRLVGGLPHIHTPVTVVFSEDTADAVIPLFPMNLSGTDRQRSALAVSNASYEDGVYQYAAIMQAVNQMPKEDSDYVGGGGIVLPKSYDTIREKLPMLVFFAFCFLFVVGFLIFAAKKLNKKIHSDKNSHKTS